LELAGRRVTVVGLGCSGLAAANLLAFELRQLSAADSDLYAINTYDLTLRSVQGTGIVCAIHGSQPRLGLYATSGEIQATPDDSALIFATGAAGTSDDAWIQSGVAAIYSPAAGGVPSCAWTTVSANPDMVVEVDTSAAFLSGVQVGSVPGVSQDPVRALLRR
jgi:hypothetical protein